MHPLGRRRAGVTPAALLFIGSAVLLGATLLVLPLQATGAARDVTTPTLQVKVVPLVGSTISRSNYLDDEQTGSCGGGIENNYTSVQYRGTYNADDTEGGVSHYNWWRTYNHGEDYLGSDWGGSRSSFVSALGDYTGDCGGGQDQPEGLAVTAYDWAGNAKYVRAGHQPSLIQENGNSAWTAYHPATVTVSTGWRASVCTCASGGRQIYTTKRGATASIRTPDGGTVALVMARGPGHGKVNILVDGVRVTTIDNYAANNKNRLIVWQQTLALGTSHVIRIKNLATAGRPRSDFDAIVR